MRLAVCTLSAVLLSGCSWLGYGGGGSSYGANCVNVGAYGGHYNQAGYDTSAAGCGAGGYGAGYGIGTGYGINGYGTGIGGAYGVGAGTGYGTNGYGVGTGALGLRGGVQGAGAYGAGGYGADIGGVGSAGMAGGYGATGAGAGNYGTGGLAAVGGQYINGQWVAGSAGEAGTVLSGAAPYGTAAGGQFVNGQWVSGVGTAGATQYAGGYASTGGVTTVQGAPIYVPQPYPSYYPVGVAVGGGLRGGYAALPFGVEAAIGTEIGLSGDIFPGAPAKPAGTNFISAIDPIGYKDAYKNAVTYELAATYDVDPSTTLLGRIGYSEAKGERMKIGTIDNRTLATDPTTATISEDLYAEFSDLEQVTLEGGVRKYMGGWNNAMGGVRPYVQGTAGFTHNTSVNLVQDSATLAPAALNTQQYIDAGWTPTASGVVGAEMQVGPRTALGVEAGLRWRDDLNTNLESGDRWSVPIKLRGRISF